MNKALLAFCVQYYFCLQKLPINLVRLSLNLVLVLSFHINKSARIASNF